MFGTGWRPDPPDERDLTFSNDHVREMLSGIGIHKVARKLLPPRVDLRPWCSPVQFQGYYNTCTAHVISGMIELLETRATGYYVPASRLFLYQVAKRILGESGDPGVYLRQMMGGVVLLGVPPEKYCPYLDTKIKNDPRLNEQPDAFCYALARSYGAAKYFRLDTADLEPERLLVRMKACLAASMPTSLGFNLYKGPLTWASKTGEVLMPHEGQAPLGSHAVLIVGYDDRKVMPTPADEGSETDPAELGQTTTGAFLFKNSWADTWGEAGYGWLPYGYLEAGLAKDCWTMMQAEWVETDQFQLDLEKKGSAGPEDEAEAESIADGPIGDAAKKIQSRAEKRRRASSTRSRSRSPSSQ
jgi:C1A family cysteine protease